LRKGVAVYRVVLSTEGNDPIFFEGRTKNEAWTAFANYARFMDAGERIESVEFESQQEFEFSCTLTVTAYGFDQDKAEDEVKKQLEDIGYDVEVSGSSY
jgi:hypothetical protein